MTKTLSFAVVHFCVAFAVGYALTGSILVGSAVALVEPMVNTVAFHFHEKAWRRIEARRARAAPASGRSASAKPAAASVRVATRQAAAMRASLSAA